MADKQTRQAQEQLEDLIKNAWTLSDDEIESLKPGHVGRAKEMLTKDYLSNHPFSTKSAYEIENPHSYVLKLMRTPEFFSFTCKHLFAKPDGVGPLELIPFQQVILMELWNRQFPMLLATRGGSKSFTLALYIMLRLIFCQGSKVVIVASAFRQAKVVFEYMEKIWYSSPLVRDLCGGEKGARGRDNGPRRDIDRCEFIIGDSVAMALPLGDGKKIRGLRANYIVAEEFASINEDIYTTVIQGFGAVTANPVQNVKDMAGIKLLKRLGMWTQDMNDEEAKRNRGNQAILSGTASYAFNHFGKYWRDYRSYILSKGDPQKLDEIFGGVADPNFNWKAYSIIRIPYELIPEGFMDASTIARAQMTTTRSIFLQEYGAIFTTDSDGFFRRSLIEKCVVGRNDNPYPPTFESCGVVNFTTTIVGDQKLRYIFGVDPASEKDQFAIAIIELRPDHRRVVYCWTTKKSDHREKLKRKMVKEHDFYRYCTRKIRDLMKVFPCERMMVDAGGGGVALREAFRDPDKLEQGEMPIYEIIDHEMKNRKDTDTMQGHHIIEMVQFRDNKWVSDANHGMKKDMEDGVLLFPLLDSLALGLAQEDDIEAGRRTINEKGEEVLKNFDTLESAMLEIEELKNELTSITVTQSATGMERWDTPETKLPGSKKGPMLKDRYSALLMANMAARLMARTEARPDYDSSVGGFAHVVRHKTEDTGMYQGYKNSSLGIDQDANNYGRVVKRSGVRS